MNFELITLLKDIAFLLERIDSKLFDIQEECSSISSGVKDIKGSGINSMDDVVNKLNDVELSVDSLAGMM